MNAWGSQCQPDVRKLFHTVLPFGCILAGPFPAEERHRETRLGARGEGGGEFKLTHYHPLTRLDRCSACRAAETGLNAQGICMAGSTDASDSRLARVGRIDRSIGEPPCARRCRRTD